MMLQAPYFVITINILCLALYTATWAFSKTGIITGDQHRKLWNLFLLIFLLIAGGLGVLLAISVSYKIEISGIEKILKWHVNAGLALVVISVLHLIRHFRFYIDYFKKRPPENLIENNRPPRSGHSSVTLKQRTAAWLLPLALGMLAMISQVVLFREFFAVFYGNEFVAGILMAVWMVLTGTGAWAGRRSILRWTETGKFAVVLLILAILAWAILLALPVARQLFFVTGSIPDLISFTVFSSILLSPFCLLNGWLFVRMVEFFAKGVNSAGNIYALESMGSMIGGVLFSLVMVFLFNSFFSLLIMFLLAASAGFILSARQGKMIILAVTVIVFGVSLLTKPYYKTSAFSFPGQELILRKQTPFNNLTVTSNGNQVNLFEDNTLMSSSGNIIQAEEAVHYAMLQRKEAKRILVMGGALTGALKEFTKYQRAHIDYVDFDLAGYFLARRFLLLPSEDSLISPIAMDPCRFVNYTDQKYDMIIMIQPEPNTLKANRMYTREFFLQIKRILNPRGVFSFALMPVINYAGDESLKVHSIIYKTLQPVFRHITIIAGEKDYFLGSDALLSSVITKMADERGISNQYVNRYYLDDENITRRSRQIMESLIQNVTENTDFKPVAAFAGQEYWLSLFPGRSDRIFMIIALLLVFMVVIWGGTVFTGMFAAGFTSASLEVLVLFIFQVIMGYLYQAMAIFFAVFMGGLALGAYLAGISPARAGYKNFVSTHFLLCFPVILLLTMIFLLEKEIIPTGITWLFFCFVLIITAMATGWQFNRGVQLSVTGIQASAGKLYFADLSGSAAGALLTAVWLVPAKGIGNTLYIILIFLVLTGVSILIKKR